VAQVLAGSPFILEVTLDGVHGGARNPNVHGLEQFMFAGKQTRIQNINGKTTASYMYTLTADRPGEYKVGPAWIEHDGKRVTSSPITISVVSRSDELEEMHDNDVEPVIVRLHTNKSRAVVGEAIPFALQLLYRDDSIIVKEVRQPQWSDVAVEGPVEMPRRIEKVDGITYHLIEWVWQIYPTKVGRLVAPAQSIDYQIPADEQAGNLGVFSMLFRQAYKTKRVYSNAVTVDVDPLPAHTGVVNAIGSFSRLHAELRPPVAKQSEGMVLLLTVDRWGASGEVKAPILTGIPDTVRSYDSKHYSIDHEDGSYTDCFEYIIQGIKPGSWEIPAQHFTFFDIVSRRYSTLSCPPVVGTILPSSPGDKKQSHAPDLPSVAAEPAASEREQDVLAPLYEKGSWSRQQSFALPWWLFMIMMSAPIAYALLTLLRKRLPSYWLAKIPFINQKRAFRRARSALRIAQKRGALGDLYPIFMNLFVDKYMMTDAYNRTQQITKHLHDAHMSAIDIERWQTFWARIEELHFFAASVVSHERSERIFADAHNWLNELEKIL
jgi:hypothetical protein